MKRLGILNILIVLLMVMFSGNVCSQTTLRGGATIRGRDDFSLTDYSQDANCEMVLSFDDETDTQPDTSQNGGNQGIVTSATWSDTDPTPNNGGGYYIFDGVDDVINVASDATIQAQRPMSIVSWIKRAGTNRAEFLISKRGGSNDGWGHYFGGATPVDKYGFVFNGVAVYNPSAAAITDLQWHHVATTVAADGEIKVYVDGDLKGTSSIGAPTAHSGPLSIGAERNDTVIIDYEQFDGMDDIGFFSRVLTLEEIQAIMITGLVPGTPTIYTTIRGNN